MITDRGIEFAVEILEREGYLTDAFSENDDFDANLAKVKTAIAKYLEASVAKGSARSNQECADAILIAYFEAYIDDVAKHRVN